MTPAVLDQQITLTLRRIDRALDVRNRHMFHALCQSLAALKAQRRRATAAVGATT
ncbi:IDEAL domain-containing protein [Amycolatopsis thermoflava]|uniref:IDEAL domain-containing protein n=1 Tax=Amycolatopsis thermoflava TaxID=84480 RepID=UPI0014289C59|nr:IDEAL domain-containing protein [Amycolatopsis thermoflava]